MTQIFTPTPKGPSARTLDLIRSFARSYTPKSLPAPRRAIIDFNEWSTLGEC